MWSIVTSWSSNGFLLPLRKSGMFQFWMTLCHNSCTVDFEIVFGLETVLKMSKVILRNFRVHLTYLQPCTSSQQWKWFWLLSKRRSLTFVFLHLTTSTAPYFPNFRSLRQLRAIKPNDAPCELLLVAKLTDQTLRDSKFSTVTSPTRKIEVACSAHLRVVRALVAVFHSARLPAGIKSSSGISVARSSTRAGVGRRIVVAGYLI